MWRFTTLTANALSIVLTLGAITTRNISLLYVPLASQIVTAALDVKRLRQKPDGQPAKVTPIESLPSLSTSPELDELQLVVARPTDAYYYNVVTGRKQSRDLFIKSLSEASESIVIVCPWIPRWTMDQSMVNLFRSTLERGVKISIGYGHLADVGNDRSRLSRDALLSTSKSDWCRGVLDLEQLQNQYKTLRLYVIGTHEKYYVVDKKYCVLGSHNFLTSGASSSEREIGLHTNNPDVVDQLLVKGFYAAIKS